MATGGERRALQEAIDVARGRGPAARELFVVEGRRAIRSVLDSAATVRAAFVARDAVGLEEILGLLDRRRTARHVVPADALARISRTKTPQGAVLVVERPRSDPRDVLAADPSLGIYLDAVQDPGNVGAIVRSAHALGATFVASGPGSADPFGPRAARSAAGAELRIPILDDTAGVLPAALRAAGHRLVLAEPDSGDPAASFVWHPRTLLALGSEGQGIGPALRAAADGTVRIPLAPGSGSLNVAQCAAILLWEHARRR